MEKNTPIVVVAYNRPRSLSRLLQSVQQASYPHGDIDLIISIDKAEGNQDVLALAEAFEWSYGTKKVVYQEVNLGLRKHILKCGDFSLEYGSVIVLEDDLFVSPNFYVFAEQALHFSKGEPRIGGISLYNHQLNVHSRDNFSPMEDGFSNWYFQFASSWGQAWTKEQWALFMAWYQKDPNLDLATNVPAYVRSWSPKSWLKYNIAYLVERELYFLYPKISLATNFSDAGTHVGNDSTIYQVPLDYGLERQYRFSKVSESSSVYDAYYENMKLHEALEMGKDELSVDLYGIKPMTGHRYVLTSRLWDKHIVASFGRSLKPHDDNILRKIAGHEFFLYDTQKEGKNSYKFDFERKITYNFKQIPFRLTKVLVVRQLLEKFRNLVKKIFK